jgi:hypothetical protein
VPAVLAESGGQGEGQDGEQRLMGWMILRQPNGLYARFSTVVDEFTHYGMTWDEAFEVCRDEAGVETARGKMARADSDADPRSYQTRDSDGLQRYRECIERVRLLHGVKKAKRRERQLSAR